MSIVNSVNMFNPIKTIQIPSPVSLQIKRSAKNVEGDPYKSNFENFQKNAAKEIERVIPDNVKEELKNLAEHKGEVAIHIKGLPVMLNESSETPKGDFIPENKKDFVSEAVLLGFLEQINKHLPENKAKINSQVEDNQSVLHPIEQYVQNSNSNNLDKFSLANFIHVENATKEDNPDALISLTLKGHEDAQSLIVPAEQIIRNLSEKTIQSLQKNEFTFTDKNDENFTAPILTKQNNGKNYIRFHGNPNVLKGTTVNANEALETLKAYLANSDNIPKLILETGDMLISDNKRALHGNYPYDKSVPADDGGKRWIQAIATDVKI